MGGQTDAEIAAICGLTPDVISWFEALHFNVRQSLQAWGYILIHCVGPGRLIGFRADELAQFWRWATLAAGPLFLDRLIDTFHAVLKPNEAPTLAVYLRQDTGVAPDLQAFVASAVVPHYGPAGNAWEQSTLIMREANASPDPDRRAFLRERAQKYIVCCGRAVLAGKRLPKFRRPPAEATKRDAGKGSQMAAGPAGLCPRSGCYRSSSMIWANSPREPQSHSLRDWASRRCHLSVIVEEEQAGS